MKDFIDGISIFCFAASYGVCLILEISRLFFRAPIRWIVTAGFAIAGLIAHSLFIWHRAATSVAEAVPPLSSWCDWFLIAACLLTVIYLALMFRRPENSQGIFALPMVLVLIGLGWYFLDAAGFTRVQAVSSWRVIHGLALLSGTVVVAVGFIAGVMYLVQSRRLKLKKPISQRFKLPSLEQLQSASETSFIVSSLLLGIGLVSGLVLNVTKQASETAAVAWSDPVVWTSGVLFLWLFCATVFNLVYKPARRGRKVAYLVVASFLFFSLELGLVLFTRHGSNPVSTDAQATPAMVREDRLSLCTHASPRFTPLALDGKKGAA